MPTNSVSEASAAASCRTAWMALNIDSLPRTDREHSSCYVLESRAPVYPAPVRSAKSIISLPSWLGSRRRLRGALRLSLVFKTELEPYHDAHHQHCCNENDQKSSGVESHWATSFTARTMRPFGPPAMAALTDLTQTPSRVICPKRPGFRRQTTRSEPKTTTLVVCTRLLRREPNL